MSTPSPQKMVKVRVIAQRYGRPGEFEKDEATGEVVSMQDKPLINKSTGRPLVNGGSFARRDPAEKDPKKSVRQWLPGEVLEMPEDEALEQIKMTPDVLELESVHEARMERVSKQTAPKAGAAYELASFMDQTNRDHEAEQRMKAMIAEKKAKELADANAVLHPSHDKDRIISNFEKQLATQQEQIARLEELITRPAGAQA